jgi:hypothetical protein
MIILYFIASIIALILIISGIIVSVSPLSEILVAFGVIVVFAELLFLAESCKFSLQREAEHEDGKQKDGDYNE